MSYMLCSGLFGCLVEETGHMEKLKAEGFLVMDTQRERERRLDEEEDSECEREVMVVLKA